MIDSPLTNDNRDYNYSGNESVVRDEYDAICKLIEPSSRIIDLGCGEGSLLKLLRDSRNCHGVGVEISNSGVLAARKKGFDVFEQPIDRGLSQFKDKEFDYAICNVTIQMCMYPETLMSEMKRISKKMLISFPNFGHYSNRIDLLFHGRMPRPMLFGYAWHKTGHIHQLGLPDFESFSKEMGLNILKRMSVLQPKAAWKKILLKLFPSLLYTTTIYVLEPSK